MSLFIDFEVGLDDYDGSRSHVPSAWCQLDPVLAVASGDRTIQFVNDEGETLPDTSIERPSSKVTKMQWRTRSRNISTGWEDGTVSLWNLRDKVLKEESSTHSSAITLLDWTPEGSRLITGDSSGTLAIWRTDHRSRLSVLAKCDLGNNISCCAWLLNNEYHEAQRDLPSAPKMVFVGTASGKICLMDIKGTVVARFDCKSSLKNMLWLEEKQHLVVLTDDHVLLQLKHEEGNTELHSIGKFRLSMSAAASRTGIISSFWTRPGLLATCAEENVVRFWDLLNDSNYLLHLPEFDDEDLITWMDFNKKERLLAVCTCLGHIVLWRYIGDVSDEGSIADWESVSTLSTTSNPACEVLWSFRDCSLFVRMPNGCSIMNETILHRTLSSDVAALQISAQKILVQRGASNRMETTVGLRIKGLDVTESHVLVWNQSRAEVYQFLDENMQKYSSFPTKAESMALYGETVFQTNAAKLQVCNLHGVPRNEILFSEHEGEPLHLHINNKFLAVATSKGMLKVFDVSRRELKLVGPASFFATGSKGDKSIGDIRSIKCNSAGTRVSILCDKVRGHMINEPDTKLYVWNMDKDCFQEYDFGPTRYPVSHCWDGAEPKLLACEAKRLGSKRSVEPVVIKALPGSRLKLSQEAPVVAKETEEVTDPKKELLQKLRIQKSKMSEAAEIEIVTLFATDESMGIMMQDSFAMEPGLDTLLGIKVPRLFFISKTAQGVPKLKGKTMRDFVGMDHKVDDETKRALIDFSYYLTIGNMDEAYRSVKLVDNISLWENMAHMCVKTRRQDVAELCMGNMGHARGACALRESKQNPEPNAHIAMVAIQLGLLEDAEKLYIECGRFDLLNKMLRSSGQWTKSLEVANSFDRIHLRETHFEYGRHLETMADYSAAIANYEASGTHRVQVPRMLFQAGRIEELESYIQSQCDEKLTQWWGQYCESIGEFERAVHVYQRAGDSLSLVRVFSYLGNMQAACDVALNSNDPAASYHLARQLEQKGDIHEAIQFYSRGGRYNHAVRLAKDNGMNNEIVNLALRADRSTMVEAAKYLEQIGLQEDAVQLYHKGGNVPRALDLCFRAELFDLLTSIADSLSVNRSSRPESSKSDRNADGLDRCDVPREEYVPGYSPEILSRCAEFFIKHEKFDKAVNLYISGGFFETALDICTSHKVTVTEEMAETMTLEKLSDKSSKSREHNERRQKLLENIARVCKKQQSFHLATKKYTQAGDRMKAMKCLLRSGDTEKIIFFAGVSRNREIYILAANYLQNLDWRADPEVMKAIISYYTKAKAFQQLAGFYEACAQMEIDEYRDYDKAVAAYKEAVKYMNKVQNDSMKDELIVSLQQRISLVERYIHARKLIKKEPDEGERMCHSLLTHPDVNTAVRMGDIFSLLIEFYFNNRDMDQAHQMIEKMKTRGIDLDAYLNRDMLQTIARSIGVESYVDQDDRKDFSGDEIEEDESIEESFDNEVTWGSKK